jgi:DNA-binding MarR family transcriptional regulator
MRLDMADICQSIEELTMPVDAAQSFDVCNCLAVRSAARHITQFYDQVLASTGLRTTQFTILANLQEKGPSTINVLAEDIVMDRTTLGRNILPLERDGLIRIEPSANDRRSKELHLTKAGEKRLQAAAKKWSIAQAQFEGTFGRKRSADLRAMLQAAVATDFEAPRPSARRIAWPIR